MTLNFQDRERVVRCAEELQLFGALDIAQKLDVTVTATVQFDPDSERESLIFLLEMKEFKIDVLRAIQKQFAKLSNVQVLPTASAA